MCGIAGIQQTDGPTRPDPDVLRAMVRTITHRGPEDDGFALLDATVLGFRRLSIIDPISGHQPMPNEDRRVWVVMNGEIYNHLTLRKELQARGHSFRSSCDTEVLVHGWEEWGEELPERLVGMFAFAVHDRRDGTLFLARDRTGQKPLFYAETASAFVFGSELRALRQHPGVSTQVDRQALCKYLVYEMVPSPYSILEGVFKLPAAHRMTVRGGRIRSRSSYHRLRYSPKHTLSVEEACSTLWGHLTRSVKSQLMADVPLGVFLSGGVDSSSIVAAMRAVDPGRTLHTFSMAMDDPSFDESKYASEVAEFFETDHHTCSFTAAELRETTAELPRLLDEPFADASILPTFLLSRFARGTVTVALAGDGGDELFAGYDTFKAQRFAGWYQRLVPAPLERALIVPLVTALPISTTNMSFDFRARQFLRGVRLPEPVRTWGWMSSFLVADLRQLLRKEALEDLPDADDQLFDEIIALDREAQAESSIDRQIHVLLRTYLAEGILTKVDRASMAVSLEVRAPLLDHCLVDWVNCLHPTMKIRGGHGKWILRKVLRGRVPPTVLNRPKKGFGIPLSRWLRGELHDWAVDVLETLDDELGHLVDGSRVRQLLERHRAGIADHRKQLWTLCCLGVWAKSHRASSILR